MNIETWFGFFSVAAIATLIPGPAMLLVSTHSLSFGWSKTALTVLGNVTGLAILSTASVLGVGVLIIRSLIIFSALKIFGALYLLYLGVKLYKKGIPSLAVNLSNAESKSASLYFQGITLALSNPKAIVFTTALFPQFIDPSEALLPQFVVLVSTLMVLSFGSLMSCAILSSHYVSLISDEKTRARIGKVFGSILIGAAGFLIASIKFSA
jgi:homoserine/homoserine lactone efflux protein